MKQVDVDEIYFPGVMMTKARRSNSLEQESRELRRAEEILEWATSFFGPSFIANTGSSRSNRRKRNDVACPLAGHELTQNHSGEEGREHIGQDNSSTRPTADPTDSSLYGKSFGLELPVNRRSRP